MPKNIIINILDFQYELWYYININQLERDMPNHVTNKVIFAGLDSDISQLKKMIDNSSEEDGMGFDFNKITPMPESLKNATSGSSEHIAEVIMNHSRNQFSLNDVLLERVELFIKLQDKMDEISHRTLKSSVIDMLDSKFGNWCDCLRKHWDLVVGICDRERDDVEERLQRESVHVLTVKSGISDRLPAS